MLIETLTLFSYDNRLLYARRFTKSNVLTFDSYNTVATTQKLTLSALRQPLTHTIIMDVPLSQIIIVDIPLTYTIIMDIP